MKTKQIILALVAGAMLVTSCSSPMEKRIDAAIQEVMQQYEIYAEMLKTFVQTGCAAAVYTQTTDVEGEVNGLMTYDRVVIKVDIPKLAEINRAVIESMSE